MVTAGIVDMLTLAAGDKSEKVQRRAMAALGELLFYIAMQSDDDAAAAASPLAATHGSPHGTHSAPCLKPRSGPLYKGMGSGWHHHADECWLDFVDLTLASARARHVRFPAGPCEQNI